MIKLVVIIPVYNGLEFTRKCLKTLSNQLPEVKNPHQVNIVLVDDGSSDGTAEWVSSNFPDVHIVKGDGNLWWSGAINKGSCYALDKLQATHVLWWNNDVVPAGDYFKVLLALLEKTDDKTVTGSKIYQLGNKNIIWSMGGYFNPVNGDKDMIARNARDKGFDQELIVDWFPGMGTVFPKKVFETIGYCNAKDFPQYHGDSDFTYRAKLAGFRLVTYPQLKLYNDTRHSGRKHNDSFQGLWNSFRDVRSLYNISKDFIFYRKYATSPLAYTKLASKYGKYIFGFLKWKVLGLSGIKRKG